MRRDQRFVRHPTIAPLAPFLTPGIAYEKHPLRVVVSDSDDGMAAQHPLVGAWHRNDARVRNLGALETLVRGKAEYKGIAVRQTAAQLGNILRHPKIGYHQPLFGLCESPCRGRDREFFDDVGPRFLGRGAYLAN